MSAAASRSWRTAPETAEIRDIMEDRLRRVEEQRDKIEAYIDAVEDIIIHTALKLRCEHMLPWRKIALSLGGRMSPQAVRAIVSRYVLKHPL